MCSLFRVGNEGSDVTEWGVCGVFATVALDAGKSHTVSLNCNKPFITAKGVGIKSSTKFSIAELRIRTLGYKGCLTYTSIHLLQTVMDLC